MTTLSTSHLLLLLAVLLLQMLLKSNGWVTHTALCRSRKAALPVLQRSKDQFLQKNHQPWKHHSMSMSTMLSEATFTHETNATSSTSRRKRKSWDENYQALLDFYNENGHTIIDYHKNKALYQWTRQQKKRMLSNRISDEKRDLFTVFPDFLKARWDENYQALLDFYNENGHTNLNSRKNSALYEWTRRQKKRLLSNRISAEKRDLFTVFPDFLKAHIGTTWAERYNELLDFYNKNGHIGIPRGTHTQLKLWISSQRYLYRGNSLSDEKRELLDVIPNFGNRTISHIPEWEERYQELLDFYNENGHIVVPRHSNPSLYSWVWYQKALYRNNNLVGKEKDLLDVFPDFGKRQKFRVPWEQRYQELLDFYEENGHINISHRLQPEFYQWLCNQRSFYRRNKLSDERRDLLDAIPNFSAKRQQLNVAWDQRYQQLLDFYKDNGHIVVPRRSNPQLSTWVWKQKHLDRNDKLSDEKKALLDAVPGFWKRQRTTSS